MGFSADGPRVKGTCRNVIKAESKAPKNHRCPWARGGDFRIGKSAGRTLCTEYRIFAPPTRHKGVSRQPE